MMDISMIRVALIQNKPKLGDIKSNWTSIKSFIETSINKDADIIVFPEMAFHGYTFYNPEKQVNEQMYYLKLIQKLVSEKNCTVIIGGLEKKEKFYLAQFVVNKHIQTYRKIHISSKENKYVEAGDKIKFFTINNSIRIGIMMCYDTHFPELATQMAIRGVEIIFAPSAVPNKPVDRINIWKKYLLARAYDNRVYVLANNLLFEDGGGGIIGINPNGDVIEEYSSSKESIRFINIKSKTYSKNSMKNRRFNDHRRPDVYIKAEKDYQEKKLKKEVYKKRWIQIKIRSKF